MLKGWIPACVLGVRLGVFPPVEMNDLLVFYENQTITESLCFTFRCNYECSAWMMRCTVFRKKAGTIPCECKVSTRLCLWQISLTSLTVTGTSFLTSFTCLLGTAVLKLGSATSCVLEAEILLGHGKCPCWAHHPKGEQVLCPAQLKYIACVYGEEKKDPHLPPGISQGRLLENRRQIGIQWGRRLRGIEVKRRQKTMRKQEEWCFYSQKNLLIFKWLLPPLPVQDWVVLIVARF